MGQEERVTAIGSKKCQNPNCLLGMKPGGSDFCTTACAFAAVRDAMAEVGKILSETAAEFMRDIFNSSRGAKR